MVRWHASHLSLPLFLQSLFGPGPPAPCRKVAHALALLLNLVSVATVAACVAGLLGLLLRLLPNLVAVLLCLLLDLESPTTIPSHTSSMSLFRPSPGQGTKGSLHTYCLTFVRPHPQAHVRFPRPARQDLPSSRLSVGCHVPSGRSRPLAGCHTFCLQTSTPRPSTGHPPALTPGATAGRVAIAKRSNCCRVRSNIIPSRKHFPHSSHNWLQRNERLLGPQLYRETGGGWRQHPQ